MKRTIASHHNNSSHRKVNGHAGANGSELSSTGAVVAHGDTDLGNAGSDDASEFSAANAASACSPAGADRRATADLAEPAAEGRFRAAGTASGSDAGALTETQPAAVPISTPRALAKGDAATDTKPEKENRFAAVPPGRKALPVNGEAFVNAVHRQVDLVQLEVTLLRDDDEKIVQRELAYLRELRYGKRATVTDDEPRRILYDAPRPEREVQ